MDRPQRPDSAYRNKLGDYDQLSALQEQMYDQLLERIAADRAKRERQRKINNYVYRPIRVIAAVVGIGTSIMMFNDTKSSEARRASVIFNDEKIRANARTPIELKLGKIAADISGDDSLVVMCGADMSVFDYNPNDNYRVMGANLRSNQTTSHKPDIFIDGWFCDAINNPEAEEDPFVVADAVFAFSHEVGHATGENDEGVTNCLAVDLYPQITDQLGLTEMLSDFDPQDLSKMVGTAEYHDAGC